MSLKVLIFFIKTVKVPKLGEVAGGLEGLDKLSNLTFLFEDFLNSAIYRARDLKFSPKILDIFLELKNIKMTQKT